MSCKDNPEKLINEILYRTDACMSMNEVVQITREICWEQLNYVPKKRV